MEEKRGALQPKSAQHNDVSLRLLSNNKLLDQDKATRDSLEKEEKKYLDLAVKYYASSLLAGNEYDSIDASRFVSLWLAHWNSEDINEDLGSVFLANVQTRKFVGLVYQLSARLSNERNVFQNNLGLLLRRMARDHPFHTLPTLFALKNIADSAVPPEATKRAAAAKSVFDSLLSQNEVHKARVQQMNVSEAKITWPAIYNLTAASSHQRLLKAYHDLALRNLRDTVKAGILKLPLKQEVGRIFGLRPQALLTSLKHNVRHPVWLVSGLSVLYPLLPAVFQLIPLVITTA